MKPTFIQKAFSARAADMSFGDSLSFKFPVTFTEYAEAVQEISQYAPLMRGRIRGNKILFSDKVHVGQGKTVDHLLAPTCIKAIEGEQGYELVSGHDLIDGWSLTLIKHAIVDLLEHNKTPTFRTDVAYPRIKSEGPFDLSKMKPFYGIRGEPLWYRYEFPYGTVRQQAKKHGMSVQQWMAKAVGEVMDNPAILMARIPEGYYDCIGHYTQYAIGSLNDEGRFQTDCSFENFTRVLMRHGLGDSMGTAFVGSFPLGDISYRMEKPIEYFAQNQIAKAQLGTYDGREVLRVFMNQAVEDADAKADQIALRITSDV